MPVFDTQKVEITTFALETTRRCNMNCDHCLRGGPHPGDMDEDLLRTLLRQVSLINQVVFSGGEPTLNLPIVKKFYEICREYRIPVRSFFVATNGRENQMELASILLEQYRDAEDKDMCSVALSIDAFHTEYPDELVRGLAFYSDIKEHDQSDLDWPHPIGNAAANGLGEDNPSGINERFSFDDNDSPDDTDSIHVETMYFSVNGILYPCCDLSVDDMDQALESPEDCPTQFIPCQGIYESLKGLQEIKRLRENQNN